MIFKNQNNQTPAEYLDQIAPKAHANPFNMNSKSKFQKVIFLSVILVAVAIILMIVLSIFGASKNENVKTLATKLIIVSDIIDQNSDNIKSTKLRALNSTLEINVTNEVRDLTKIASSYGVDVTKLTSSIKKQKLDQNTLDQLEDARLNAIFDRTYAREMSYQLELIINIINQIIKSSTSSDLKTFANSALNNLTPIQQGLADFNELST